MNRKYSIDVLKCLATILIIFHHYQQMTGVRFDNFVNFYNGNFYWGNLVELFFILSGYVTYKYVEEINEISSFWKFFAKKYFRFIPMVIICGLSSVILTTLRDGEIIFDLSTIITSFLGIARWLSMKNMVNNPVWYISVLLLCYICFFGVTYIARRLRINPRTMFCMMIVLGMCMVAHNKKTGIDYPFWSKAIGRGYYTFFFGIILREILEKTKIKEKLYSIVFCCLTVFLFVVVFIKYNGFIKEELWYVLPFGVFPCIIILFEHKYFERLFSRHWLKPLGGVSFNAFMWHVNVINVIRICAKRVPIDFGKVTTMFMVGLVVFACGYISYKFMETPISKFLRKKLCEIGVV